MSDAPGRTLNYDQARRLLLLVGLIILLLIALTMYVRRVDPTEVAATVFFLPIYMAFLYAGVRGGLALGALAAVGYVVLRMPAIDAVGAGQFLGLIVTRTLGFLVFGGVGGWAAQQLTANITKLDLYDHVDDETRLHNSRSFVDTIDRERSRTRRYGEVFSVFVAEGELAGLGRRQREGLMRELGQAIRSGVRAVDYPFHVREGETDLFGAVLPETGREGAATFGAKLTDVVRTRLDDHGISGESLSVSVATYPEDDSAVEAILDRVKAIVRVDFPEASRAK